MDPEQQYLCGLFNLLDELERLTRSSSAQNARISGLTSATLSEVAVIAEFERHFELHQPRPAFLHYISQEDLDAKFSKTMNLYSSFARVEFIGSRSATDEG